MLRSVLVAGIATIMLALAAPAFAVNFTSSTITTPTDGAQVTYDFDSPTTLHVEGTTTGGDSNADLVCFYGSQKKTLATNVTVTAGAFSADLPLNVFIATGISDSYCLLRAVPTGDTNTYAPTGPNHAFAGPRILFGETRTLKVGGTGANQNVVRDFFVGQAQTRGYIDFGSFGQYGLDYSFVHDPITLNESAPLFFGNAWAQNRNGCGVASSVCTVGTQSGVRVDGNNAYGPNVANSLYSIDATHQSRLLTGFPELTYTQHIDPLTGDAHITETDPMVQCSPNGTAFHATTGDAAWNTDCTSFASTGLKLDRTIDVDQSGRRAKVVDVWTNTDNVSHDLEVLYEEWFAGDATLSQAPSFAYSWKDPSSFSPAVLDQTIQGPGGSAPGTIYVDGNGDADDTFQNPQGAVTFSPAPDSIRWWEVTGTYVSFAQARFAQTIPAGGTATVSRTYVDGGSKESIAAKADAERDRFGSPAVAITSPADGAKTDDPNATVTGTASDPGGAVTSLKVNGDAVSVAPDGTWSKALTLKSGDNTITAVAEDAAGNSSTATAKVTYTPKPVVVTPPPADKTAPVIGLSVAKTKLRALLAKGLPVTVSSSEACTLSLSLMIDSKTAKRLHLSKVTALGKGSISVTKAGKTKVVIKLTKKAKAALKSSKRIVLLVKATAKDAAGNAATKTKKVAVKR